MIISSNASSIDVQKPIMNDPFVWEWSLQGFSPKWEHLWGK